MKTVEGKDLKVGDVIEVWWRPGRDTIVSLSKYEGPLTELHPAIIAEFAQNKSGMTIRHDDMLNMVEL